MNHNSCIRYKEWLIIPLSYYQIIDKKEAVFELGIPTLISSICTTIYIFNDKTIKALKELVNIIPTVSSILIGFTVMLITILLTSNGSSIDKLKTKMTKRKLNGRPISLFQSLHVEFCFILLQEVSLLIIVLFCSFLLGINIPIWVSYVFLFLETAFTLSILLAVVRSITNLYLSFWNKDSPL